MLNYTEISFGVGQWKTRPLTGGVALLAPPSPQNPSCSRSLYIRLVCGLLVIMRAVYIMKGY